MNIVRHMLIVILAAIAAFTNVAVVSADEFEPVMQVLENYYQSQQEKNMEGYLATQVFESDHFRERERRFTEATWRNTSVSDVSLGPAQVAINEDATEALVRFLVGYQIELKFRDQSNMRAPAVQGFLGHFQVLYR